MVDTLGDPNAVITDPTGGAPNFNVFDVFKQYGYYPTQEEINAIAPSFEGRTDPGQIGSSAVAQFVMHKRAEAKRQQDDPLRALQKKMQDSADQYKQQVQGLYTQLQDVLTSAPQLFGNLTPDQIQQYLGPLQTAFKQQLAQVQGTIASRGLAASSTENAALAETGKQFQENVFQTGLGVGIESQKNKAAGIENQINRLLGLAGTEEDIAGRAAGQQSSQDLGQSNLIASLPFFLNQASQQESFLRGQEQSGGGFWDTFNKVTSGINQGINSFQSLAMIPNQFKTAPQTPGGGGGGSSRNPWESSALFQSPVDTSSGAGAEEALL